MITYEKISKNPQVAISLIGMPLAEFEKLYDEFERAHIGQVSGLQYTQRHHQQRRRAVGAGRKYKYALCDRLIMTLFWLRAYTTYEVLASFYDLDKTTIEDNIKRVLNTLATMADFHFEYPQADVPKLRSVQEVITAFPGVLTILESEDREDKLPMV